MNRLAVASPTAAPTATIALLRRHCRSHCHFGTAYLTRHILRRLLAQPAGERRLLTHAQLSARPLLCARALLEAAGFRRCAEGYVLSGREAGAGAMLAKHQLVLAAQLASMSAAAPEPEQAIRTCFEVPDESERCAELAGGGQLPSARLPREVPFRKESGRSSALEQQSTTGVGQDREAELASNATDAMPSPPPPVASTATWGVPSWMVIVAVIVTATAVVAAFKLKRA